MSLGYGGTKIYELIEEHSKEVNKVDNDFSDKTNQNLIKSGDLIVNLSSFENGFQKEENRYRQEIWDYIQFRESLVRWPPANEKIKMGISLNHG